MIALLPSRTVAAEILGFPIHWYGIMYLAAFLLAWYLLPRLQHHRDLRLTKDDWSTVLSWAVIGVIAGGRLGYAVFYALPLMLEEPLRIFAVWQGGMSFHGGFLGCTAAILWALRGRSLDAILRMGDVIVVPVALGLALGRIGNFINGELYGPVTSLPWAVEFPGVEGARHPTQLYACMKDLLIAFCCWLHLRSARPAVPGRTWALFMMMYGVLRFLVEYVRIPDVALTDLGLFALTRGQLLSVPVFLLGAWLWTWAGRRRAR